MRLLFLILAIAAVSSVAVLLMVYPCLGAPTSDSKQPMGHRGDWTLARRFENTESADDESESDEPVDNADGVIIDDGEPDNDVEDAKFDPNDDDDEDDPESAESHEQDEDGSDGGRGRSRCHGRGRGHSAKHHGRRPCKGHRKHCTRRPSASTTPHSPTPTTSTPYRSSSLAQPTSTGSAVESTFPSIFPTVWKTLVIVYRTTNITYPDRTDPSNPITRTFHAEMKQAQLTNIEETVAEWANLTFSLSGGLGAIDVTIAYPDHPVTFEYVCDFGPTQFWLCPQNNPDVPILAPIGSYDSIIAVWKIFNETTFESFPQPFFGLTAYPPSGNGEAGWSEIIVPAWDNFLFNAGQRSVFLHEWMHQVLGYYSSRNALAGITGDPLHSASNYGYFDSSTIGLGFEWVDWYRDLMRGVVVDPSTGSHVGIGPCGWSAGTPTNPMPVDTSLPPCFGSGGASEATEREAGMARVDAIADGIIVRDVPFFIPGR
eukprot:Opistho-2@24387